MRTFCITTAMAAVVCLWGPATDRAEAAKLPAKPKKLLPFSGSRMRVSDNSGHQWDVREDGRIDDGTNDCFDGGFRLLVNGNNFSPTQAMRSTDSTFFELRGQSNNIQITRDIWIDKQHSRIRYLETFTNKSPTTQSLRVDIMTRLGGSATGVFSNTGGVFNGGTLGQKQFGFASISNNSRPCVMFLVASPKKSRSLIKPTITVQSNRYFTFKYTLKLKKGQTLSIAHMAGQRRTGTLQPNNVTKAFEAFYKRRPIDFNLTASQRKQVVNFRMRSGSLIGSTASTMQTIQRLAEAFDVNRNKQATLVIDEQAKITGTVTSGPLKIQTAHGPVQLPLDEVALIAGGAGKGRVVRLFLRNGEILTGPTEAPRMLLSSTTGLKVPLDTDRLHLLFLPASPDDGKTDPDILAYVQTHDGNRLAIDRTAENLAFPSATAWGNLSVPLSHLAQLKQAREPHPGHWMGLDNGTRLRVLMLGQPMKIPTTRFGEVTVDPRSITLLNPVKPTPPKKAGRFTLVGENVLTGRLADPTLNIGTSGGMVPLKREQISEIHLDSSRRGRPVFVFTLVNKNTITGWIDGGLFRIQSTNKQWAVPDRHLESAEGLLTQGGAGRTGDPPAVETLHKRLKADPKDHAAARQLIGFFLLDRSDPKRALEYAKMSGDADLARIVALAKQKDLPEKPNDLYLLSKFYFNVRQADILPAPARKTSRGQARKAVELFLSRYNQHDDKRTHAQKMLRELQHEAITERFNDRP
ncbi:MAG: hypothetical protein R3236_01365 [Phycisphaeraceae bacterium]|nr:hypothetical protein [Phycisphaeraceae bacterium]